MSVPAVRLILPLTPGANSTTVGGPASASAALMAAASEPAPVLSVLVTV